MEGVLVIKNVSVKLFSFINVGSIGDQERVCQTLQLHQWREYWWSKRVCQILQLLQRRENLWLWLEGVLVSKNVSVKLFSFINGGSIGSRKCLSVLQLVIKNVSVKLFSFKLFNQWREYWWSRTCLSNSFFGRIGDEERVFFSFFIGGSVGEEERVCQTLQLHKWREYWWSRTCLSISLASSMEGVLMIKNVSLKLVSFINGVGIGDEERACQTLLLIWRREYWWSRTYLSNSSAFSMEGVLVIKNVSVKLFSFINVGSIGDQERVCQTLQLHQWREYWWSKRVCQILQLLQRRENLWWRTCLANSSVSSVEAVLVMKNVSLKLVSFINGGSIGDQERVCQTLQLLFCRDYWWSRTCLSNSSASLVDGVLMIKNVSVKIFSFINGGGIGDEERACQTLLLI